MTRTTQRRRPRPMELLAVAVAAHERTRPLRLDISHEVLKSSCPARYENPVSRWPSLPGIRWASASGVKSSLRSIAAIVMVIPREWSRGPGRDGMDAPMTTSSSATS